MTEGHFLRQKCLHRAGDSASCQKTGLSIDKVAEQYDLEGLTEALCAILSQEQSLLECHGMQLGVFCA